MWLRALDRFFYSNLLVIVLIVFSVPALAGNSASAELQQQDGDSHECVSLLSLPANSSINEIFKTRSATSEENKKAFALLEGETDQRLRKKIMDKIVVQNQRLVYSIAKHHRARALVDYEFLVQAGNLGLMVAVAKFKPQKGFTFSTYATKVIEDWINDELRHEVGPLSINISLVSPRNVVEYHVNRLTQELGAPPSNQQIAEAASMRVKEVEMLRNSLSAISLDKQKYNEADSETLKDHLTSEDLGFGSDGELLDAEVDAINLKRALYEIQRDFEQEVHILMLRTGITLDANGETQEPLLLKEVGEILGINREYVRQIEVRAHEILKTYFENPVAYKNLVFRKRWQQKGANIDSTKPNSKLVASASSDSVSQSDDVNSDSRNLSPRSQLNVDSIIGGAHIKSAAEPNAVAGGDLTSSTSAPTHSSSAPKKHSRVNADRLKVQQTRVSRPTIIDKARASILWANDVQKDVAFQRELHAIQRTSPDTMTAIKMALGVTGAPTLLSQIGDLLGVSEKQVATLIHRGLTRIQKKMAVQ